ncbi:MAG: GNAT family N-acetyltransferase [Erysipelotrichaceae bacterium]|jgi:phosphinothricin acetyltransferase|nr:GNAT family N-acetyltransferase [Erysipelotrichaceae bacterium]
MEYIITAMLAEDWPQVLEIYRLGIESGLATFEKQLPSYEKWDSSHLQICRFTAKQNDKVLGFAALSPTSARNCYRGVVEVSLYVHPDYARKGIGKKLMEALIEASEANGLWCLYSAIIAENKPSISLHEKCGFRIIGHRERIAQMEDGSWHDTCLMERRSKVAGQ